MVSAGPLPLQGDAQGFEVPRAVPQVGAVFADLADQQVGDGHARIGRFGLIADDEDLVVRCMLAQGFGGNDAGRAGAEDDVLHGRRMAGWKVGLAAKRAVREPPVNPSRPKPLGRYRPRRERVSGFS